MMDAVIIGLVPVLCMLSLGGLAYFVLQALRSGAEDYAAAYTDSAARQMEDMFLFIPPRRVLELATASAAVCFLLIFLAAGGFTGRTFVRGVIFGAAAAAAGWNIPRAILKQMQKRRMQRFNEQLVDGLVNMGNALRAGFSIQQAIELVVKEGQNPIAQELGMFLHQIRVGMRIEDAFDSLRQRVGSEDLTLMIMAIEVARQTGGNLPEVFAKISHTIRERMRIHQRIRTLTAMQRLQGLVLGGTPVALALIMFVLDPRLMAAFAHSTVGMLLLALAVIFEIAAALVIRKIVAIDV